MGSNKKIDKAIELKDDIDEMLTQQVFEAYEFKETISIIEDIYNRI